MPKVSEWPAVFVRVDPSIFAVINALAQAQALPASVIVRQALDKAFKEPAKP